MSRASTRSQVSAGGVVYRAAGNDFEVVLIAVGPSRRWQLPKGLVGPDESAEDAALREVREETGLTAEFREPIDIIEYWYYGEQNGRRVRFRKTVHFFLMRFESGSTEDHDDEVQDARWFPIETAQDELAFPNEKDVVAKARDMLRGRP
jgi:8-oxo-dGTP diphosphatase